MGARLMAWNAGPRMRTATSARPTRPRRRPAASGWNYAALTPEEIDARVDALAAQIRQLALLAKEQPVPGRRRNVEAQIVAIADEIMRARGWLVYGIPDSRLATSGGFPDRVYCRPPVALFVEWKLEGGKLHGAQPEWLAALSAVRSTSTAIWRPSHVEHVLAVARDYGR